MEDTRPNFFASFLQDLSSPFLWGWKSFMREPADDYRSAYFSATSKAIDSIHNSGWLAGGVLQATAGMVGSGLSLNARPASGVIGNDDETSAWAKRTEGLFESWASSPYACDTYGRHSLHQQCFNETRGWFGTGEIVGVVRYIERPGNAFGTKIMALPSTRLTQAASDPSVDQGVKLDADGCPVAYVFDNPKPVLGSYGEQITVQARDTMGRPQVIHIHDSPASVVRGLTPFAPVLKVVKQFDTLANATLTKTLIQNIFAATIQSDAPTEQLLESLQSDSEQERSSSFDNLMFNRLRWYKSTKLDMLGEHGKIAHLFPGESLDFKRSESPNTHYKEFCRFLLMEIARCIGITYEQFTGDRENASYSSERMGGAEAWIITSQRRKAIPARFMQIAYEAWLEEAIEKGLVPFPGGLPGFLANRDAASRADWRGPPKPTADDLKTAKANQIKLHEGIITREMWSAEEGTDWDDMDDQTAREQKNEKAKGIVRTAVPTGGGPAGGGGVPPAGKPKFGATLALEDALLADDDDAVDAAIIAGG